MSRHIIIALVVVLKPGLSLWHHPVEKFVEIVSNCGIGILVYGEACGCMLYKKVQNPYLRECRELLLNKAGNQMYTSRKGRQLNM
jgi:hypothetical protein